MCREACALRAGVRSIAQSTATEGHEAHCCVQVQLWGSSTAPCAPRSLWRSAFATAAAMPSWCWTTCPAWCAAAQCSHLHLPSIPHSPPLLQQISVTCSLSFEAGLFIQSLRYLAIHVAWTPSVQGGEGGGGGHAGATFGAAPMVQSQVGEGRGAQTTMWDFITAELAQLGPDVVALNGGGPVLPEAPSAGGTAPANEAAMDGAWAAHAAAPSEEELVEYEGMLVSAAAAQRRRRAPGSATPRARGIS